MSDELSLFGDEPVPAAVDQPVSSDERAAPWQIKLLRELLDTQGLVTMAERQQAIEGAVGHPVESLKTLTRQDALAVVDRLGKAEPKGSQRSSWDDREGDTWIDAL